ncbi:MAG: DUF488 domain-containing protein [Oscillospiraceae bacterium]|nr:DUF488 domain-containing protein [Oscillospiraceae bacterium]
MHIFTIGYTKKSAQTFFEHIKSNKIDVLVDVRLYNSSQLAGYSKSKDLAYFLRAICNCDYMWASQFAPTSSLLNGYKDNLITWAEYEKSYNEILAMRNQLDFFERFGDKRICLLCAEELPARCHRRLLAEITADKYVGTTITHL